MHANGFRVLHSYLVHEGGKVEHFGVFTPPLVVGDNRILVVAEVACEYAHGIVVVDDRRFGRHQSVGEEES